MESKKITAIIQARLTSSRLKNKILNKINNQELIFFLILRVLKVKNINDVIVAIPNNKKNDYLNKLLVKKNIKVFRGSEHNVLERFYDCAKKNKIKHIVRITSDCPLLDSNLVNKMAIKYKLSNADYLSNTIHRSFPDGLDVEFFNFKPLKSTYQNAIYKSDKEHVTSYIKRSNLFKKINILNKIDYSNVRVTLDYKEDFDLIKKIIFYYKSNDNLGLNQIIKYYKKFNIYFDKNQKIIQKKKYVSKQELPKQLWNDANNSIAGGNSLFSKRPDIYLNSKWPTYFTKAKGCMIYGVDGKKYFDCTNMGVGTNILGYSNTNVDNAVKERISRGNMSTLNSIEEIKLAQKLLSLHLWADKVKFTRSGGEANSVAIRLARASTNKQKVAFCGYHGWHDWYLSANLKNKKNLDEHLIPGLNFKGVYKSLKGSAFPFKYNDIEGLRKLLKKEKKIGIIKMEVMRNINPKNNFLKKIRELADKNNLILIFDECTSGFRETFGGIHLKYKIEPDLLVLGKALGNGFAINAILGKQSIMNKSNETFISSTFWTESSGYAAALKTLEIMKKKKSWIYISRIGKYIKSKWLNLAKKHNIKIHVQGISSLPSFIFKKNHMIYKSFITQEMLKKNILATNTIYVSMSHNKSNLKKYFKYLDKIFSIISNCENNKDDIFRYFDSEISRSDFKRLN